MSSPRLLRAGLVALALAAPALLAGCTGLRPVYGGAEMARGELDFRYSEPQSRLEQIIIQDLALRLGRNDNPDSPLLRITARTSGRAMTSVGVVRPVTQREATVIATYMIVVDGTIVAQGSRRASAIYTTSGQVMANDAALRDATERAATEVAQMIRLAVLGDLNTPRREAAAGR